MMFQLSFSNGATLRLIKVNGVPFCALLSTAAHSEIQAGTYKEQGKRKYT
jgi:hypothetical protein